LSAAIVLSACGANGGISTTGVTSERPMSTKVASVNVNPTDDPHAARLAVCVQRTDGTSPTIDGARVLLEQLTNIAANWSPDDAAATFSNNPLDIEVRPILDPARGSSFDAPPLLDVGIPPTPQLHEPPTPSPGETVPPDLLDAAERAGRARSDAQSAAHGAASALARLAAALKPDGSDGTSSDLAGCAAAARNWLMRDPVTDAPRVLVLLDNDRYRRAQDIGPNTGYTVGSLDDLTAIAMVSMCSSSSDCDQASESWKFFNSIFVRKPSKFIPRDAVAAGAWLSQALGARS
jgi:hypothetical protein